MARVLTSRLQAADLACAASAAAVARYGLLAFALSAFVSIARVL
jgi:hypothetical protein